jgi:hypothetical protein
LGEIIRRGVYPAKSPTEGSWEPVEALIIMTMSRKGLEKYLELKIFENTAVAQG